MTRTSPDERHLEVRRTARFFTLGPWPGEEEAAPGDLREVWYVLHGYGQLARRFLRRFTGLDDGTRLIVAPEGLSRFYVEPTRGRHGPGSLVGATWMTREDREREIGDYLSYLDGLARRVEGRLGGQRFPVTVLGFSQGVHTAARWAVLGESRVPDRLILWGAYLPPDLDMERAAARLRSVETTLVRGREDGSLEPELAEAETARLDEGGLRPVLRRYPGGHDIDRGLLEELAREGRDDGFSASDGSDGSVG